ncbi:hypothetical protein [Candidatus Magnetobacterium casense]|uniref:Uncharacterized protein n=1 Tax=Candidatus Magnetobacterium casense TaxID=1455061 RepID=A0ABS6RYU1_9BACT|nr:hypothetical protein [Candidatus Magnetobacterium casensis]MBV6341199.1 hypothetical protein [Candidatus Magnetobacterium casensis]
MNKGVNTLRGIVLLIVTGVFFILSGCAGMSATVKSDGGELQCGKVQGAFRGRWFNYYERGVSFSSCGQALSDKGDTEAARPYLESAVRDFEAAIRIKKYERWHARTYGMHYVDYFPHRELGIAQFLLGEGYQQNNNKRAIDSYKKAQDELAISLGLEGEKKKESDDTYDTATSKAVYYLNEARGKFDTKEKPQITILTPQKTEDNLTNACKYEVSGIVSSKDGYVKPPIISDEGLLFCLKIKDGKPSDEHFPVGLSAKECGFKTEVDLCELDGKQDIPNDKTITIKTLDVKEEKAITVTLDREGPGIAIAGVKTLNGKITVEGTVYDDNGIESVIFNGKNELPNDSRMATVWKFNTSSELPSDTNKVIVEAKDKVGNITKITLPGTRENSYLTDELLFAQRGTSDANKDCVFIIGRRIGISSSCVEMVEQLMKLTGYPTIHGLITNSPTIPMEIVTNLAKNFKHLLETIAELQKLLNEQPPVVEITPEKVNYLDTEEVNYLNTDIETEIYTYENFLNFNFSVSNYDDNTFLTLYNNDKEISKTGKSKLNNGEHSYSFSHNIKLKPNTVNTIKLVTINEKGKKFPSLFFTRKLGIIDNKKNLLRLGIVVFNEKGNFIGDEKYKKIVNGFINSKRFEVVTFDKNETNKLKKHQIKPDTIINGKNAKDVGIYGKVDLFLLVTIKKNEITTDLIETGCFVTINEDPICTELTGLTSIFSNTSTIDLKQFSNELVKILEYKFPFIDGRVLNVKNNEIIKINIGEPIWKSRAGTRLFFFNKGGSSFKKMEECYKRNFFHNEVCQDKANAFLDIYGKAVVTNVYGDVSEAKILNVDQNTVIQIHDRVMTK